MVKFSVSTNQQTEELLDKLLQTIGGKKIDVINLLADRFLRLEKENQELKEQLDEERALRKSLFRNIEYKVDVLYEVENTRLHVEPLPELKRSSEAPSGLFKEIENYLDTQKAQTIFHQLEKRVSES
ncbi:hypothetical protein [Enterococcus sp. 5B3_DIV0040]|uniref:hypothetical protein n=1 Tax=Enterococcus sp. 5B3_DIV0040 TaxID=1834182 RepID=UPI000A34F95E|nr:hypothetical protein [Enterococcus sp. 5B3_DIV0040]OTO01245.1 hypothetical protein A5883_003562 [Enterococcus sp. 5B3_DIV0040]